MNQRVLVYFYSPSPHAGCHLTVFVSSPFTHCLTSRLFPKSDSPLLPETGLLEVSGGLPSGPLESDLEASPHPAVPTSLWERGPSSICLFWWVSSLAGILAPFLVQGVGDIWEGVDTPS